MVDSVRFSEIAGFRVLVGFHFLQKEGHVKGPFFCLPPFHKVARKIKCVFNKNFIFQFTSSSR
jgi:hypothetical protein